MPRSLFHCGRVGGDANLGGGIGDWFQSMSGGLASKVEDKKQNMARESQAKQFKQMVTLFLNRDSFSLFDMRTILQELLAESGAQGWRGKLGGEEVRYFYFSTQFFFVVFPSFPPSPSFITLIVENVAVWMMED